MKKNEETDVVDEEWMVSAGWVTGQLLLLVCGLWLWRRREQRFRAEMDAAGQQREKATAELRATNSRLHLALERDRISLPMVIAAEVAPYRSRIRMLEASLRMAELQVQRLSFFSGFDMDDSPSGAPPAFVDTEVVAWREEGRS